ncbi:MAG: hypothetical protein IAE83_07740 [Anaerolinea sp.]|nr:hypothetical protein [Anaerolinea sp.]
MSNQIITGLLARILVLDRFHYAHLQDKRTGAIKLAEGPCRMYLNRQQEILGKVQEKIRLTEGQYVIVLNPYSADKKDIVEGEREVRAGPAIFALHPGEFLAPDEHGLLVRTEYVLSEQEALLLQADRDAPHPTLEGKLLRAGERYLLQGPGHYTPHKNVRVLHLQASIPLSEGTGIYIQNDDTGEVQLVTGPADVFLEANQRQWQKHLSQDELEALGYSPQSIKDKSIRVLSAGPKHRTSECDAVVVSLEGNEVIYLYDGEKVRVVFGPQTVFLGPNERPKVLYLSAGVPVTPNTLKVAKLSRGPEYFRDRIDVRTRDNASLELEIAYRWRFDVDEDHPERLFALKDFIGFAAQTLSSDIRGEAARHDFDRFHAEAGLLVTRVVFNGGTTRVFPENGLVIFGVDVERITPKEDKISEHLATAILNNVEITTETARKKAQMERERELIAGNALNEEQRKSLLTLELENEQQRTLADAQTAAEKKRIEAQMQAEVERIQAQVKAETERIQAQAKADSIRLQEQAKTEAELDRLQRLIQLLESPGGQAYIQLERARVLKQTDKIIVPTDARIHLGTNGNGDIE